MTIEFIELLGATAAAASLVQILLGQGRQFLRIGRCTPIETSGIDCRAFWLNGASHLLWAAYGASCVSLVILAPNAAGALISGAIALRASRMQRMLLIPPMKGY